MEENEEKQKLGLRQIFASVLASFAGVQSDERRRRDFTHGRPRDFIIVGLVLTVLFILTVWGVVELVTSLVVPRGGA
ncbi:MAG: DUF2970 domain-containing protein [Gammaproteobacteria bacterium]|nr:MAG: DUF2970 domain-containing protein [Gammaproteobacteria bacterium]